MEFSDWIAEPENWTFAAIGAVMVATALRTVTSPNVVHAALYLVATLAGSAALFVLLGAEFVAWTVVLVYIGAVVVLFLFGVMITRAPLGREEQLDHSRRWPAALVALAVFTLLATTIVNVFEDAELAQGVVRTGDIGDSLFERFVIPFEVVSVLLLAALIGGIVLARRDPADPEESR